MSEYSIDEIAPVPDPFVRMIDDGDPVTITRDGEPVAVCIPYDAYQQLLDAFVMQAIR